MPDEFSEGCENTVATRATVLSARTEEKYEALRRCKSLPCA
jgi:hypothetical protein